MARIEQLKVYRDPLHVQGSPLVIEAYALLIDRQTNRYYAQIKFANIDERVIRTIAISITAKTIAGEIELDHLYSGIVFASGTSYGSQVAVPLGEAQVLDIRVAVILVELEDGDSWKGAKDTEWRPLPPRRPLEELSAPEQSLEMYRSIFKLAKYIPRASDTYWQCACGKINPAGCTVCMGCGFQACDVMAAANLTALAEAELKWKKALIRQVAYAVSQITDKKAHEEELERKRAVEKAERERKRAVEKAERERREAERNKREAEEKLERDRATLAEAQELLEGDTEEQLNKAMKLFSSLPNSDAQIGLAAARTKLADLRDKEKRRKRRRNILIVSIIAALCIMPFAIEKIKDQIAVSKRLKPSQTEVQAQLSYKVMCFEDLCHSYIDKALNGEELKTKEIKTLISDNVEDRGSIEKKTDSIFEMLFPSVYEQVVSKGKSCRPLYTNIEITDIEDNKYSIRAHAALLNIGFKRYGEITYTVDLYFGVPNSSMVTFANAQIVNLHWS